MELEGKPIADWESARSRIQTFVDERDWDQFHNIKDLAIGLGSEAGELLEQVLWKSPEVLKADVTEEGPARDAILDEVADILFYVIRLMDKLGAEPWENLERKLAKNSSKYPVELARGRSDKYTAYQRGETSSTETEEER